MAMHPDAEAPARENALPFAQGRSGAPIADGAAEPAPWHACAPEAVLARLQARRGGLTTADAGERRARHGPNALPEARPRGAVARLLAQFDNLLIYVLIAAAGVTALLGHWTDTAVIMAVVIVNALVGYWQEGRAEDAMRAVRDMLRVRASVLRDGARTSVDAVDLVPGDVVLLEAGDRVPADLRLIEAGGCGRRKRR